MKTITKQTYLDAGMDKKCGGDCWNEEYVARKAFQAFPEGQAVRWEFSGTGLWVDAQILVNGAWITLPIYG